MLIGEKQKGNNLKKKSLFCWIWHTVLMKQFGISLVSVICFFSFALELYSSCSLQVMQVCLTQNLFCKCHTLCKLPPVLQWFRTQCDLLRTKHEQIIIMLSRWPSGINGISFVFSTFSYRPDHNTTCSQI